MIKPAILFTFLLSFVLGSAQDVSLPADLRQHTLTQYNASLFNPTFSLDRNNPQSVAFWTRWQWQTIDADPTTLFLNYTRSLNESSVAGAGFFQHNTGVYFNTGGALNYAYQIEFNRLIKLSVGANVFGFIQKIADTRFPVNPIPGIPQTMPTDDFIVQVAPGINLKVENFSMSLASENLFDYNFTDKASNTATADKIFMGMASYDFPVMASDSTAYIRPSIYLRTIPEQENQIGMNALFSTQKYWAQAGFNNFYGISVGAGGTVMNRFSLGALVEFGTSGSLNSKDPSFEIVASYFLGKPEERRKPVASGIDETWKETVLVQNLTIEQMREELRKAEASSNAKEEGEKAAANDEEIQTEVLDKKELRKLAIAQKAIERQQRKDSVAVAKKEKEALVLLKKEEDEQARVAKRDDEEAVQRQQALGEAKIALAKQKTKDSLVIVKKEQKALALMDKQKQATIKANEELNAEKVKEQNRLAAQTEKIKQQQKKDSIRDAKKTEALAKAEAIRRKQESDAIALVKNKEQQRKQDSITKAAELLVVQKKAEDKTKEEIVQIEEVKPQAGEKYEEVINEDGLEPGFYLIANVFGTKKYFDAFMNELRNKGIEPKSFYRSNNKYNYAYLEKYNTISEARKARDSNFNGKYEGKIWIFRVVR